MRNPSSYIAVAIFVTVTWFLTVIRAEEAEFGYRTLEPRGHVAFLETFQNKGSSTLGAFVRSEESKYGKDQPVKIVQDKDGLPGDNVMSLTKRALHYAVTAPLKKAVNFATNGDGGVVVQYEVRWPQEGDNCGGAYVKLFAKDTLPELKTVNDQTPYVVMFGPDKCGSTSKVHLILRHKNPISGEYEEKHLKKSLEVAFAAKEETQVFTLVVKPDDTYKILVDNEVKASGNLLNDLSPPLNPPKEIDDPEDVKPEDWVDEAKIPNMLLSKPDDWDEDAPQFVDDEDAVMPEGWEENESEEIADPDATLPDDWDEDEDGEWEAPTIANPLCIVGCGEWKRPKKKNPEYKGKWVRPMMDNPDYKGEWAPRRIENPAYFELDNFAGNTAKGFDDIAAIAVEVWTMKEGVNFDNFLVVDDESAAREFAENTAILKTAKQLEAKKSAKKAKQQESIDAMLDGSFLGLVAYALAMAQSNLVAAIATGSLVVLASVYLLQWCCCSSSVNPPRGAPINNSGGEGGDAGASAVPSVTGGEEKKKKKKSEGEEDSKKKNGTTIDPNADSKDGGEETTTTKTGGDAPREKRKKRSKRTPRADE